MKVLVTGKDGQLGQALQAAAPKGWELLFTGRDQLDLADPQACRRLVAAHGPDWVINAGAFTAVDRAESEPERAHAVNEGAPRAFAQALAETGGRLLQLSTDYVFNGAQSHPYQPEQTMEPLGVYGRSKAAAEGAVIALLGQDRATILRTGWVYGPVGKNFCRTMLNLHHQKAARGQVLGVVADQVGCPTSTLGLAAACWALVRRGIGGCHHWSDAGAASWYDFAVAIGSLGTAAGLLEKAADVRPLTTADYPTPAKRPFYSLLDCTATRAALQLPPLHWGDALADVLAQITARTTPALHSFR
ncbi:dTDP-4-dehydrorhamnose reductase [Synechococcus sp. Tobar12-5m-g]|uniref:dTDP-4-dehydrorhamnose reductase n=1 Tax=unclassified Synechococcus TaxID=2626047 RepID=UPI0020CEEE26|nr:MULTISPECIES: dTDP-4-dehydrorhamnose reductase [unclassified Synechococcus]MCP9772650.1 dTDP-4-dehydrorhamnose reductase [Synechococcus sp. Tobar12-5m-g]MCP9873494.1 dTDP-4-dehydrorhamnose reductase [Synechococcus sp. Cruz CV-v-12]